MDTSQQQHAANIAGRQIKKQSNSDEQAPQHRGKASSTTRPANMTSNSGTHTAQKRQMADGQSPMLTNDGSGHAQRRQDRQQLALEVAAIDSNEGLTGDVGPSTEQPDGLYYQMTPYAPGSGSGGGKQGKSTMSDGMERRHTNAMGVSQSIGAAGGSNVSQGAHHPLSNKSDANISAGNGNQHASVSSNQTASRGRASGHGLSNGRNAGHSQHGDGKNRKRKSSEKAQRRASNNRRAEAKDEEKNNRDPNGVMIPPIDAFPGNPTVGSAGGPGSASQTRSQSRGTAAAANAQMQPPTASQLLQQQYYSGTQEGAFQLFGQGSNGQEQQQAAGFGVSMAGLGMGGVHMNGHSHFPFGNSGSGSFMGGSNQAPQVHFIAKKQQFIAQISPEQLIASDKRPYTAQSLNNFSQSAKRAGGVYGNTSGKASSHGAGYHLANAAFTSQPAVYLGQLSGASRTHTNGFSFHPPHGTNIHKYSNSLYGDDVKPKVAGKDILHALGSSNGFSSGYSSDPYNSVMSSGLPATLTHSTRPAKAKAQNRLQTKEKEQLYDETIKMKMLNNQLRDDSVKLKTKIKILENELNRKEKTIEDLFSHNQLIQQSHSKSSSSNSNQSLLPLAQTAQKYQQETFLVMSLKKQIRELKYEVVKRDEELEVLRKNIRNTKTKEMEQEIQTYREECLRQRAIMEDLLKQGAAHPIHQQAFHDRMAHMQAELQRKDSMIQQLTDTMNQSMKVDATAYHSGQSSGPHGGPTSTTTGTAGAAPTHSTSLAAVRSQESQQLESSPSAADVTSGPQVLSSAPPAGQSFHQGQSMHGPGGREKSGERKGAGGGQYTGGGGSTKEIQRDLQRARKAVREKEKEIMKLKTEINHIRRESQEKLKNESQQHKDNESQVKQLREKQRDLKMDLKRKDDKLSEAELKAKRMDEQFKEVSDALKMQEEANKQLKSQLRAAKSQKQSSKSTDSKAKTGGESAAAKEDSKKEKEQRDKDKDADAANKNKEDKDPVPVLKSDASEPDTLTTAKKKDKKDLPTAELQLITLIGQREKLSRDDLTAMMLAGEESLKMLIRKPSEKLINFIKSHLDDEDAILVAIPRFEMPKADFESQVLREMRLVLRENADRIADKSAEELMKWPDFEAFYNGLDNFEYPHKDKLLDFIKYFFLDHIESADLLQMNYQAFKEHVSAKRPLLTSAERTRNASSLRSRRRSGDSASFSASADESTKRRLLGMSDEEKADEEKMLDVAEQCFMRIADLLHRQQRTVKQAFLRFSEPEPFKDGTVLELMSPRAFLEGVREVGFEDVTEMEVACLMKVLAKPELDGAVILNEFVLIMENFGVPVLSEEDEYENDYIPDSDAEDATKDAKEKPKEESTADKKEEPAREAAKKEEEAKKSTEDATAKPEEPKKEGEDEGKETKSEAEKDKDAPKENGILEMKRRATEAAKGKKGKHPIVLNFDILDAKAVKILKKLARFLLERYMHPREFFGPTIKKEILGKKKNKVEIIKHHDFYLRLKLASIRKKLKENATLNQFVAIDGEKFPGFVQVKRLIKALEIIAEGEQELMVKEQEAKEKERKEAAEQAAKERAEKGLPPLEEEEAAKEADAAKAPKKPEALDIAKPPAGPRGVLDEMLRLGGRGSPQNGREREGGRFGSGGLGGPPGQLNTIEEDLHETQTSHYSQAVREGDITDREGSKHQLSTSNQLRNSNALHELEDSARRSATAGGSGLQAPASAGSADGGAGSRTSPQKISMKVMDVRNSLPGNDAPTYPLDLDEADQRMKDELDAEVDKKYKRQLASSQDLEPLAVEPEDDYEDDFDNKDEMKEDTIKTDKIEQLVEEDMNLKGGATERDPLANKRSADGSPRPERLLDLENQSIDELDVQAALEGGAYPNACSDPAKQAVSMSKAREAAEDDDYSFHDEATPPHQNVQKSVASPDHSDIEEDYEI